MFFRNQSNHTMTDLTSDTDFSKIDRPLAEPFTENKINSTTNISHGQESVTDPNLTKQTPKLNHQLLHPMNIMEKYMKTSTRTWTPSNDHHVVTWHHQALKRRNELTTFSFSATTISSPQVKRMQQTSTQADISQRSKENKPENRMCFRCNQVGHIAKKCRTRILQKQRCQNTRQHQPSRKQSFNQNPNYQISRNIRYNPSTYHTRHNGQPTTQRSKHTFTQTSSLPQHKIQLSGFPNTESSLLDNSSQKTSVDEKTNHEDWTHDSLN